MMAFDIVQEAEPLIQDLYENQQSSSSSRAKRDDPSRSRGRINSSSSTTNTERKKLTTVASEKTVFHDGREASDVSILY